MARGDDRTDIIEALRASWAPPMLMSCADSRLSFLELLETRRSGTGVIQVRYRIRGATP